MNFVYNENACKIIIDLNKKLLETIKTDLIFLENELNMATEPAVRFAFEREISRRKYDEYCADTKIREMEHLLGDSAQP
jgi:hypothetical protein